MHNAGECRELDVSTPKIHESGDVVQDYKECKSMKSLRNAVIMI